MARLGMDDVVVEQIGNSLKSQAEQIHSTIAAIDGLISQAIGAWEGNDATQFNDWWQSQHKPHLTQAAEAIDGLGVSALNNVEAQRAASGS